MLSKKTVNRLSRYRKFLTGYQYLDRPHIFSHDLARMLGINPVHVRRDLMLIGFPGSHRKGYDVNNLIELIDQTLDHGETKRVALVGLGKLGSALLQYLNENDNNLVISAAFDLDPGKVNRSFEGIPCFDITQLEREVTARDIKIAVLTTASEDVQNIANILVSTGIEGILNFTPEHLCLSPEIYVMEYDVIMALDEIGYFIHKPGAD
jgi:redox-sensing transcriptional repressor